MSFHEISSIRIFLSNITFLFCFLIGGYSPLVFNFAFRTVLSINQLSSLTKFEFVRHAFSDLFSVVEYSLFCSKFE